LETGQREKGGHLGDREVGEALVLRGWKNIQPIRTGGDISKTRLFGKSPDKVYRTPYTWVSGFNSPEALGARVSSMWNKKREKGI